MMLDGGVRVNARRRHGARRRLPSEAAMLSRGGWNLGMWKRKGALRPASIRLVATAATAPRIATAFAERIEAAEGHATDSAEAT